MSESEKISGKGKRMMSQDGKGARDTRERHCALCGDQVNSSGPPIERFGEAFCSEGHAEEFVKEVRAVRVRAAVAAPSATGTEQPAEAAPKQRDWKAYLAKGLCWGAPLLALVFLLGGGSTLLGAASGLLPVLALLACPLGMYFMMRAMAKKGNKENPGDKGGMK